MTSEGSTIPAGPLRKPLPVARATVFGGGAFGTGLALLLVRNEARDVRIWHPNEDDVDQINKTRNNEKFLPGVQLPEPLTFTADVAFSLFRGKADRGDVDPEVIIFAIPTQFLRKFLKENKKALLASITRCNIVFMACKGIETSTLMLPTQIYADVLGEGVATDKLAVIAGPSFAKEVAEGKLTAVTVAARSMKLARHGQELLTTADGSFRCFASAPDMVTCEIASAVKNVIAIAAGAADGIGLGMNARAFLITRGLVEIVTLARAMSKATQALDHPRQQSLASVMSLAGVGDVVLTCTSTQSRNFTVGQHLGKGESMEEIRKSMTAVAEGVATAESISALSHKLNVHLRLCEAVHGVLRGTITVEKALHGLVDPAVAPLSDEPLVTTSKL